MDSTDDGNLVPGIRFNLFNFSIIFIILIYRSIYVAYITSLERDIKKICISLLYYANSKIFIYSKDYFSILRKLLESIDRHFAILVIRTYA